MFRGHVRMYSDQQYFITGVPQTLVYTSKQFGLETGQAQAVV